MAKFKAVIDHLIDGGKIRRGNNILSALPDGSIVFTIINVKMEKPMRYNLDMQDLMATDWETFEVNPKLTNHFCPHGYPCPICG